MCLCQVRCRPDQLGTHKDYGGLHVMDMIRTPAMGIAKNYWDDHIERVLHFHSMGYGLEHGTDALDVVCSLAWLRDCQVPVR